MNLTGQFLISMPSLQDERFEKTVIYMCAHSKDGAMGIIINKKIDYDLYPDLLEQLGIDKPLLNKKLYIRYGGPVESGRGFVLHSDEVIQKETLSIAKGLHLLAHLNFLKIYQKVMGQKIVFSL